MSDNWKARLFDLASTCVAYDTGRIDHEEWETNVLDALAHFSQIPTDADMEWAQRKAEGLKAVKGG